MNYDAQKVTYQEVTIFDRPALFTECRIDQATVPEGVYRYELRHGDEDWGEPIELSRSLMVNFYGTVLTREPFQLPIDGWIPLESGSLVHYILEHVMRRAGADRVATGENPVIVACRSAQIIVGPIGIAIADALMGEISPAMANAVASSNAYRVLIPMNLCSTYVAGVDKKSSAILDDAMAHIRSLLEGMENKP